MTTQIAVKLESATVTDLDELIAEGRFSSRSQAVRLGLSLLIARARADEIDLAFANGFIAHPETESEMNDARRLAEGAIAEEPWEPWW